MLAVALALVVGGPCVALAQSTRYDPNYVAKMKAAQAQRKAEEAKKAADAKAKADKKRAESGTSDTSTSLGDPTTTTWKNEDASTTGTVTVEPRKDKNGDVFFRYIITVDDGKCRKMFGFDLYFGPPVRVIPHPIGLTEPSPPK
jgi:hypothetical protein